MQELLLKIKQFIGRIKAIRYTLETGNRTQTLYYTDSDLVIAIVRIDLVVSSEGRHYEITKVFYTRPIAHFVTLGARIPEALLNRVYDFTV